MIFTLDLLKCAVGHRQDLTSSIELQDAVAQCLQAKCTVVDSLVAKRYFTQTCQVPARDNFGVTRGVGWVLYTLTVICVAGRFLFRNPYCQGSGYGLDDWLIIVSLAILTPIVALVDETTRHGLGQDIWMLTPQQISRILYVSWACEIMYAVLMATTKIAILMLYLRIWQAEEARNKRFRIACYALCCVMVCFAVTFGLLFGLSCSPVSYAWERWDSTKEGTCLDVLATLFACAAINIVLDFMVCLLPIPKLTALNMSTPKKIGISFIFVLGLFVTICSIVRFNYLVKFAHSTNPSWDYQPIASTRRTG
ncbi:hypothetical protein Slin15195_G124990 [Septoria linicola]|uniref:Rhodopsin domain-containing protein n=1 Tax=Septoria linicola TaxID=215465 RepID=A0A9Q9B1Z4_9PEZI|nr:hypothetical protein Slin14017_G081180 [Septoria linicola]USW59180.1 hypothetical protein Slin15195_G124990 [Septoria linicola]